MSIKRLTPNRHFQLIERILRHVIRVQFVHLPSDNIDIWLMWFREQEELRAGKCLETSQTEVGGFEDFNARSLVGWDAEGGRRERLGNCVDTGSGQLRSIYRLAIRLGTDYTRETCLRAPVGH